MTTMTRITTTAQKRVAGGSNRALLTLVLEPMQYMQDCVLYRRQVEVKGQGVHHILLKPHHQWQHALKLLGKDSRAHDGESLLVTVSMPR
eukprot:19474-Heterococcus_DN1.PRE.2